MFFFFFHKNLIPVFFFFNLENQIEMKVFAKKAKDKVPDQTRGHNIYETVTSN